VTDTTPPPAIIDEIHRALEACRANQGAAMCSHQPEELKLLLSHECDLLRLLDDGER
jgi:hypothetical protein